MSVDSKTVTYTSEDALQYPTKIIRNLKNCETYYFACYTALNEVYAAPSSIPMSVFIDGLPPPPCIVTTLVHYDKPMGIQIIFKTAEPNTTSSIVSYRLYHSNTPKFESQTFEREITMASLNSNSSSFPIDSFSLFFENPEIVIPHYFKMTALNQTGESVFSETSLKTTIDFEPDTPTAPIVKKLSDNSLSVYTYVNDGPGSSTSRFILKYSVINEAEEETMNTCMVPAVQTIPGRCELMYNFKNVTSDDTYSFAAIACNSAGESNLSEWAESLNIGCLVPSLDDIEINIASATCFKTKPPVLNPKPANASGYRIKWYKDISLTALAGKSNIIPLEKPFKVDDLPYGECFYVTGCLANDSHDGIETEPVVVTLCSAIPLPLSPKLGSRNNSVSGINSNRSSISRLSVNEKLSNLHKGYSAFRRTSSSKASKKYAPFANSEQDIRNHLYPKAKGISNSKDLKTNSTDIRRSNANFKVKG